MRGERNTEVKKEMIIRCSKCGYIPKTKAKFCEICGKELTDEDRTPFLMTGKTVEIPFPLKEEKVLRAHSPASYKTSLGTKIVQYHGTILDHVLIGDPVREDKLPVVERIWGCLYLTDRNLVFIGIDPVSVVKVDFRIPLNKISSIDIGRFFKGGFLKIDYEHEDRMESKEVMLGRLGKSLFGKKAKKAYEFYTNYVLPGWKTAIEEAVEQAKKTPAKPKEALDAKEKLKLLEERLLKSEISEETYKELKKKYEQG